MTAKPALATVSEATALYSANTNVYVPVSDVTTGLSAHEKPFSSGNFWNGEMNKLDVKASTWLFWLSPGFGYQKSSP